MLPRVQKNVREWTFTLSNEFPFWELEAQWTSKFLKGDYKGQNSLDSKVFYIFEKLLKRWCLKWARMTHLNIWNTSYDKKKGRESNWQFDSWSLKVRNRPDFLRCGWCDKYLWKALDEGYNFALNFISMGGFHAKLWGPKVAGVLILGISGHPLNSNGSCGPILDI
jgi:hypothetical protein